MTTTTMTTTTDGDDNIDNCDDDYGGASWNSGKDSLISGSSSSFLSSNPINVKVLQKMHPPPTVWVPHCTHHPQLLF